MNPNEVFQTLLLGVVLKGGKLDGAVTADCWSRAHAVCNVVNDMERERMKREEEAKKHGAKK